LSAVSRLPLVSWAHLPKPDYALRSYRTKQIEIDAGGAEILA